MLLLLHQRIEVDVVELEYFWLYFVHEGEVSSLHLNVEERPDVFSLPKIVLFDSPKRGLHPNHIPVEDFLVE